MALSFEELKELLFQRSNFGMKLGLERMRESLSLLGDPQYALLNAKRLCEMIIDVVVGAELLFQARYGDDKKELSHDFGAGERCCCGGCAPGLPGPYAVPQPQTSEPRPRRRTRSR